MAKEQRLEVDDNTGLLVSFTKARQEILFGRQESIEFDPTNRLRLIGPRTLRFPFSAPVTYVQPNYADLKHYSPFFIDAAYEGNSFYPIECCKNIPISDKSREVTFRCICGSRGMAIRKGALARIARKGCRPALYEELLGYVKKFIYPPRYMGGNVVEIVALGSESLIDDILFTPYMRCVGMRRELRLCYTDQLLENLRYSPGCLVFLVVPL